MNLLIQFQYHLNSKQWLKKGDHILLAVSGGLDSMTLLYLLEKIKTDFDFSLSVIHIDHKLRQDSWQETIIVKEFCEQKCIPCYVTELEPSSKPQNQSTEEWAREKRYQHFARVMKKIKADKLMTAHHGDDQVETILMHIAEGTGIGGLKGIHENIENLIRPMLNFSRKEIEQFAVENSIKFVEDPTNKQSDHPRNFLRHHVIPQLKEIYPQLHQSISNTSKNLAEAEEALTNALILLKDQYTTMENDHLIIHLSTIAQETLAFKLHFVKSLIAGLENWRQHEWNLLKYVLTKAKTGNIIHIGNSEILKNRNTLIIQKKSAKSHKSYAVKIGQKIQNEHFTFLLQQVKKYPKHKKQNREIIDLDRLPSSLQLRTWQEGDHFKPLGMEGNKKISDYLIDIKMDRFAKRNQLVLAKKNEVVWLCGQRISEDVKVLPVTKHFGELSFQRHVV